MKFRNSVPYITCAATVAMARILIIRFTQIVNHTIAQMIRHLSPR